MEGIDVSGLSPLALVIFHYLHSIFTIFCSCSLGQSRWYLKFFIIFGPDSNKVTYMFCKCLLVKNKSETQFSIQYSVKDMASDALEPQLELEGKTPVSGGPSLSSIRKSHDSIEHGDIYHSTDDHRLEEIGYKQVCCLPLQRG
jgi:hypothetical protein